MSSQKTSYSTLQWKEHTCSSQNKLSSTLNTTQNDSLNQSCPKLFPLVGPKLSFMKTFRLRTNLLWVCAASVTHVNCDKLLTQIPEPKQIVKEMFPITFSLMCFDKLSSDNKTAGLAFVNYLMTVTVLSCRSVCG